MESGDSRLVLARRLRALREEQWPAARITQELLAKALDRDKPPSVSLISAWESKNRPTIPPSFRVEAYGSLFATRRSLTGDKDEPLRLIPWDDLTPREQAAVRELTGQLTRLRMHALEAQQAEQLAADPASPRFALPRSAVTRSALGGASPRSGPWRFEDEDPITVVCAHWPDEMLRQIPYTDPAVPDFIELLTYSELDSLFELFGHLRSVNPDTHIVWRRADRLDNNDYTAHLVSLGGVDWNRATTSLLEALQLPVRQIADWDEEGGQYFEADAGETTAQHRPVLERRAEGRGTLREDVALFARAVNPNNQERTVTICSGMYGRGTYGVVRALTDPRFHARNAGYLMKRFGSSRSYCLLSRVRIMNNETLTPDWTIEDNRLFEWSDGPGAGD